MQGKQESVNVVYDPTSLGEQNAKLEICSKDGGIYEVLLKG